MATIFNGSFLMVKVLRVTNSVSGNIADGAKISVSEDYYCFNTNRSSDYIKNYIKNDIGSTSVIIKILYI